jgi:ribosomal protein L14E/L6E/L27E
MKHSYHRLNITVLQGTTVIKQLVQVKIINTVTNPNEAKRLSEMSIDELTQRALQEAEYLITKI